jgi:hypothetical protein
MRKTHQKNEKHVSKFMELPSTHSLDFGRHLFRVAKEIGRLNIEDADLADYQRRILSDLINSFEVPCMTNLAAILSYLKATPFKAEKPPLSISCKLTSKGNLSIVWKPNHFDLHFKPITSNLVDEQKLAEILFVSSERQRPKNELVFIRNAEDIFNIIAISCERASVDANLASLILIMWNEIKTILSYFFDIQVISDLQGVEGDFEECGLLREGSIFCPDDNNTIIGLKLVNLLQQELSRLDNLMRDFFEKYGIPLDEFEKIVLECTSSTSIQYDRISKILKKRSIAITPSVLERLIRDIEKAKKYVRVVRISDFRRRD